MPSVCLDVFSYWFSWHDSDQQTWFCCSDLRDPCILSYLSCFCDILLLFWYEMHSVIVGWSHSFSTSVNLIVLVACFNMLRVVMSYFAQIPPGVP